MKFEEIVQVVKKFVKEVVPNQPTPAHTDRNNDKKNEAYDKQSSAPSVVTVAPIGMFTNTGTFTHAMQSSESIMVATAVGVFANLDMIASTLEYSDPTAAHKLKLLAIMMKYGPREDLIREYLLIDRHNDAETKQSEESIQTITNKAAPKSPPFLPSRSTAPATPKDQSSVPILQLAPLLTDEPPKNKSVDKSLMQK